MKQICAFCAYFVIIISETFSFELDLNSSADGTWTARNLNGSIKVAAAVPGGIYSDLLRSNVLNESLYYRFNDLNYRWVAEESWSFSRKFTIDQDIFNSQSKFDLICDGLDTVSSVYLNGKLIGKSDNQFVKYIYPIKMALKPGENSITINFTSPIAYAQQQFDRQDYLVPPKCVPPVQNGVCHANHIRKMQASFSWDWGPAFPNVGIWKSIRIVGYERFYVHDMFVDAAPIDDDLNKWHVSVRARIDCNFRGSLFYTMKLMGRSHNAFVNIPVGYALVDDITFNWDGEFEIDDHDLWFPNGSPFGAPVLHTLELCLNTTSNSGLCRKITFGFRSIQLIQELVDSGDASKGKTFYLSINAIPTFMKGSNWIPADSLTERVTTKYLRHLLQSARDANMNMLRVWGGGIYELDEFYQMADQLGILIWQDFMFACSMYPTTKAFLDSVKEEVITQYWRLRGHPSVAVWAGNNENEAALRSNWYGTKSDFQLYKNDYVKLYVDTIRNVTMDQIGSDNLIFLVSSPSNGIESENEDFVANNPYSNLYGDVHYYDYVTDPWNLEFPRTRFASEYGYQSWSSFLSLLNVSIPEDWSLNSNFSKHRQHHLLGNSELLLEIGQHFKLPQDVNSSEGFLDFIYLSQINQALAIKSETEFYRRGRSELNENGEGYTMGAMYWQLNDIWQAPTWSSIEYGGKWKMLHYYAKKFFSPLLASSYVSKNEIMTYVISDLATDMKLSVGFYFWNWTNEVYHRYESEEILVKNNSVTVIGSTELDSSHFVQVVLHNGSAIVNENILFLIPFTNIDLPFVNLEIVSVDPIDHPNQLTSSNFNVTIKSDSGHPVPFVWLETELFGTYSDNGFVFITGNQTRTKTLTFKSDQNLDALSLKNSLKIKSLQDAYQ